MSANVRNFFPLKSRMRLFYAAHDRMADMNEAMLHALYGQNPITDDELRKLIEKRPHVYGRFAGFLGKR